MATVTFKNAPHTTNGDLPKVGEKAPEFKELINGDLKEVKLKDYKGKKKLLNIVPSLDTEVCATSTRKFNEEASKIPNAVVLVISADLPFAQKRFCSAVGLENVIPLSLMRSQKTAKDYGVLLKDGLLAGLTARAVVVMDENDKVIYTQLVDEIANEPDYAKALAALK